MIIAVVALRVMKATVDQVIDMITVWNWFVGTTWSVDVSRFVATAVGRALIRGLRADFDLMFVYVIAMRVVQMAIMKSRHGRHA